jgi:GR25 family glycosyltransferase involved in LPS biosynthesis
LSPKARKNQKQKLLSDWTLLISMKKATLLTLCFCLAAHAFIEDYYKKIETEELCSGINHVDQIYLINLDQRPEKWNRCLRQLLPFNIYPQRVSGIYGWALSSDVLNNLGMQFQFGMWTGKECVHYFPEGAIEAKKCRLDGSCYGKTYFSQWTTKGAIGCALSHLSVLQHAYDSWHQTIWILEDDISVVQDPHQMSDYIEKLDAIVGNDGWDMLFTDNLTLNGIDSNQDLLIQLPMMWRPDIPFFNLQNMLEKTEVGDDFIKIGSRMRFHSVIYRRPGIEKILKYYKDRRIFMPIDHEFFFVPTIRAYVIKKPIVCVLEESSDTRTKHFNY